MSYCDWQLFGLHICLCRCLRASVLACYIVQFLVLACILNKYVFGRAIRDVYESIGYYIGCVCCWIVVERDIVHSIVEL